MFLLCVGVVVADTSTSAPVTMFVHGPPTVEWLSYTNDSNQSDIYGSVNATLADNFTIENVSFYLWNSSALVNSTVYVVSGDSVQSANYSNLSDGQYYFWAVACANNSLCGYSSNLTILLNVSGNVSIPSNVSNITNPPGGGGGSLFDALNLNASASCGSDQANCQCFTVNGVQRCITCVGKVYVSPEGVLRCVSCSPLERDIGGSCVAIKSWDFGTMFSLFGGSGGLPIWALAFIPVAFFIFLWKRDDKEKKKRRNARPY